MGRVRVLILIDKLDYHGASLNGPARYFGELVRRLDPEEFTSHLVTLRASEAGRAMLAERGVGTETLNFERAGPMVLPRLIRYITKQNIDLLQTSGYGAGIVGRIAARLTGRPCVIRENWVDPNMSAPVRWVERLLSRITTRAIAVSNYSARFLIDQKGMAPDKVEVVPSGVARASFQTCSSARVQAAREAIGIPEASKVVGMVGMLHANKGHALMIEAMSQVVRACPEAMLLIVGEGEERASLEAQIRRQGLGERVRMPGQRRDIAEVLKLMDVYVLASNTEAFPLALLEAMASGRAIVATASGGPDEVIRDERNGYLVRPGDAAAIADRVVMLLKDRALAQALGRQAAADSAAYDLDNCVRRVEALYRRVVEQAGQPTMAARGWDRMTRKKRKERRRTCKPAQPR